jgi:hypothetical protein
MKRKIIGMFVCMLLIATAVPAVQSLKNSSINSTVPNKPLTNMAGSWTEMQKLLASDGVALDYFGHSVSLDGDTALIGSYQATGKAYMSGSAYVFTLTGNTWTQQAQINASDGGAVDEFGFSVSLSGDTALIGACNDDDNGVDSGSAYVFTRSGTTWNQQQKLLAQDGAAGDHFGCSVSLSGNTALIGAYTDDTNVQNSGSTYVFTRTSTTWTLQQKLLASDGAAGDMFGWSVSLSGDTALIGAMADDDNGVDSGSAYVFTRNINIWTQQPKLLAQGGVAGDYFGCSVSLYGDTALIGAYGYNSYMGAAYAGNINQWTSQQKLIASNGPASDYFGVSVALLGDYALIGAMNDNYKGAAYMFTHNVNTWTQKQKLFASDGATNDRFGWSISLSGDTALIGAFGNHNLIGSAYVFTPGGPDLIIHDRSSSFPISATLTLIGDNTYEPPIWGSVTQKGKWFFHIVLYHYVIELQNDNPTATLSGYTIDTTVLPGTGIILWGRLFYNNGWIHIPGSTTSGLAIPPGGIFGSSVYFIVSVLACPLSNPQIGIHVISTSGSEDSVIIDP